MFYNIKKKKNRFLFSGRKPEINLVQCFIKPKSGNQHVRMPRKFPFLPSIE